MEFFKIILQTCKTNISTGGVGLTVRLCKMHAAILVGVSNSTNIDIFLTCSL